MGPPLFARPKFDALRNALYHTERRNFFDFINRSFSFLVIILGTGVVAKGGEKIGLTSWLEIGTVFFATMQLVFDFGTRARQHDFLQRRYYELLSDIEAQSDETEEGILKYSAKLLLICAEEPMTMRALDAIAYNKTVDATIFDTAEQKSRRLKVTRWQRTLKQFCAFQNTNFISE